MDPPLLRIAEYVIPILPAALGETPNSPMFVGFAI
jgi:hypothetical protein